MSHRDSPLVLVAAALVVTAAVTGCNGAGQPTAVTPTAVPTSLVTSTSPATGGVATVRPSLAPAPRQARVTRAPTTPAGIASPGPGVVRRPTLRGGVAAPAAGIVAPTAERATRGRAASAVLGRSLPVRLRVPAIGVDSALMQLGLTPAGALEVPPGAFPAGWYTGSPSPGERGPAVIVGHVDWGGRLGVFARLARLRPGDRATVVRADGSSATFEVNRVERFAKDAFPTQQVYGDIDHAGLRLITCGGAFDRSAHSYVDDVVVFADLVS